MRSFAECIFLLHEKIRMTLQVSYKNPLDNLSEVKPEKSVPPFISALGRLFAGRAPASLTVEAAMSLPLFLFFAAALMQPMHWLDRQRKVQTAAECVGEELSVAQYLAESDEKELWSDAAAGLFVKGKVGAYTEGIRIKKARAMDSDGMICLEVAYKEKLLFFTWPGTDITMNAASRRRPWIGLDGKLKAERAGGGQNEAEKGTVFVGANMGRYHLYRDCHYISNQYEAVSAAAAGQKRNSSGNSYKPCSRCSKKGASAKTVYITPEGAHYHSDTACSAMVSYVRTVPLEEVEHLGVCSYCTRRGGRE